MNDRAPAKTAAEASPTLFGIHSKPVAEIGNCQDPLRDLVSSEGKSLEDLSHEAPQLVVFLRHFGCTFCREALADLAACREQIEQLGCRIALIHMLDDGQAEEFFSSYGLGDVSRISDGEQKMYQMFGLDRGSWRQLFGLKVWFRALTAGLFSGHGLGAVRGNPFQMPGVFVLHQGRIVTAFQHDSASDRPDYLAMIRQAVGNRGCESNADSLANKSFQAAS